MKKKSDKTDSLIALTIILIKSLDEYSHGGTRKGARRGQGHEPFSGGAGII